MNDKSEKVTVYVGSVREINAREQDDRRSVEFTAKRLGSYGTLTGNDDTRGVTETLYRTDDGRLIVYVEDWSRWQGETSDYALIEVTEDDLQPGGDYEMLGYECGYGRPLTLDEALGDAPQG